MQTVQSRDGTRIAFDRAGNGPPVILVDGALCYRASGPSGPLTALLADHFTVFTYDRRGRGDSGNTLPVDGRARNRRRRRADQGSRRIGVRVWHFLRRRPHSKRRSGDWR